MMVEREKEKKCHISIIIPAYNVEKYIGKTLNSALNQSFNDYEIVVVDDGSKDATGAICDDYAFKYDRICVIHQENSGVMAARLKGVESCKGEWVTFLDGDDCLTPTALADFMSHITDEIDVVWGRKEHVDVNGKVLMTETLVREVIINKEVYQDLICKRFKSLHALLFRKQLFDANIRIDREVTNNEDIIFNLFLSTYVRKVAIINNVVHSYLERGDSVSKKRFNESYWYFLFSYIEDNFKKWKLDEGVYNNFCLNRLCNLIRSPRAYHFDYDNKCFDNMKKLTYSQKYGINGNLALFILKHPSEFFIDIVNFHPRALLSKIKS